MGNKMGPRREGWLSEPSKLILLPQHPEPRMPDYIADPGVWRVNLHNSINRPDPAQHLTM